MLKKKKKNFHGLQSSNWGSNTFDIFIKFCSLDDDETFWLLSLKQQHKVFAAGRRCRGRHPPTVLSRVSENKELLCLFKISYCCSSQVDPEFSGWLNTVAAFFCLFFIFLTFFLHISMIFSLSLTPYNSQSYWHTLTTCNTPSRILISLLLRLLDMHTHSHKHTHSLFPGSYSSSV